MRGSEMRMITSNPGVMTGKPAVRDTRITVETIVERIEAGAKVDAIVAAHPRPTRDAVVAALSFATGRQAP